MLLERKKAKEMDYEQRKEYRIEHETILEDLKTFAEKTALEVTPKVRSAKL